ncbi:acyltransferase [Flagellimonas sp.]|uniref:acyltransferase n=1 Tax=Flagellimonas sp. TaxID=2058762 RepID=UPI003B50513F
MNFLKKLLLRLLGLPNTLYNRFILTYKKVEYKQTPSIYGKLIVLGQGRIVFGENVEINSSLRSNPIGGDSRTIMSVAKGAIIQIGNNTGMSNVTLFCKKGITIGDNVKIGGSVKIYDSDFHALDYVKRRKTTTDITNIAPVSIGNDCFIGAHSIILKGVEIGNKSIVGAGSVVTKSIPEGEIWAGNPAKLIRRLANTNL